jgi:predicted nucleic acid-binding protein
MSEVWDTTTAARLRPDSTALAYARERRERADPVAFSASTFCEVAHGLRKAAANGSAAAAAQLGWLRDQIDAGLLEVLPFDDRAAEVAGALRADTPLPPPASARRSRERSKAETSVAWMLDIQTAATAFVHGYDLLSGDAHHGHIAERLAVLAPGAPALRITPPPRFG